MSNSEIAQNIGLGIAPILAALIAGRFLRRLILKPFELLAERTQNKFDDQLLSDAKADLGLDPGSEK